MATLLADLRFAFRTLGRNPGFSAIVILILAIGIGANTAVFSIVDGVLLRPLPFRDPQRLFAVQEVVPKFIQVAPQIPVNAMHFGEWRKHWSSAEQLAMIDGMTFNLTSGGEPERINGARASSNLFAMLGIEPRLGRSFLEEEDRPGHDRVVILSDSIWQRRFHGDPNVLGRKILLDGAPFEVVGVLGPGVRIPTMAQLQSMIASNAVPEIWKPFAVRDDELDQMGDFNYSSIARLKRGVSMRQALDELNAVQAEIASKIPEKTELRAALAPLDRQMTGRSRQGLLILLAAVAAILLIVCVNIADLMLSRAMGRTREMAVRMALGASSQRLLRQMLTESGLIALIGGALGIALAYAGLGVILANAPADLPRLNEVRIDGRVLGIAFLLSLVSAVLFGLAPAWRSSRADPQVGLKSGGRGATEGRRARSLRSALVAVEAGLSTACLIAAGLLLNSFVRLLNVDKGFDVERVVTVDLRLPALRYPDRARRSAFLRSVLDRAEALPGVTAAGATNLVPLTAEGSDNIITFEGTTTPIVERPIADFRCVSEDYFRAMGIPLLRGRVFGAADRNRGVTLVSALTAARFWPGENPLGKRFRLGGDQSPLLEVIGVVGDVRSDALQKAPGLTVYVPYWQRDRTDMSLMIRAGLDPAALAGALRGEIRKLDPELPVPQFETMRQVVSAAVGQRRFQLTLALLFAAIALALASLGIYGVVSYSVEQRRGEMGIRMALGATAAGLRALIVRQGLRPVLLGVAAGVAAALAAGRILRGLLFGVAVADPLTMASVAALLLAVAAAACYVPALRLTRSDPMGALRQE